MTTARGVRRLFAPTSALLLVLQAVGAGTVGLLHAAESLAAPVGIEAEHGKSCVVIHDPARCPGCQASGPANLPQPSRTSLSTDGAYPRSLYAEASARPAPPRSRDVQPRAPPSFSH